MAAFWLLEIDGWLLTNRQSLATSDWTLSRLTALVILPPSAISAGKNGVRHKVGRDKDSPLTLDVLFQLSYVLPDNFRVDNVTLSANNGRGRCRERYYRQQDRESAREIVATRTTSTHHPCKQDSPSTLPCSCRSTADRTPLPTCMSRPSREDICQCDIACICKRKT